MNYCGYHTHTTFSDGKNSMEEMVLAAIERGMPAIGFSDHSDSPYQDYCMRVAEYPAYLAELDRLAAESNYSRNELINLILQYGLTHIEIEP
jgi:histidinol-phosphatase (PHP family)